MSDTPIADDTETETGIWVFDPDVAGLDEALAQTTAVIDRWRHESGR